MAPTVVRVATMDETKDIEFEKKTTGRELNAEVARSLSLEPCALFNLQYTDKKGTPAFFKMDKKITKHDYEIVDKKNKDAPIDALWRAQYYPELVADELRGEGVQRLFWLQIRAQVIAGDIYVPPEMAVLFAATSMQAQHGDYDAAVHTSESGIVNASAELPSRVLTQHNLTPEQWIDRICNCWQALAGVAKSRAIMDYLSVAQDLEQYGVTYYEVTNKRGTKVWLGVQNSGMYIYKHANKVVPLLGFPWREIRNISFNNKKFTIRMVAKDSPPFIFKVERFKLNKRILALCVGNHQFFVARRRAAHTGAGIKEDRAEFEAKIARTREQLLAIRTDLESAKQAGTETTEDIVTEEARAADMDKFKTMKKAGSGAAKDRIKMFEEMSDEEDC